MCRMPSSRVIRTVATAFIVAIVTGAAQLGMGYALGTFSWLATVARNDESAWLASLAWTVFICGTSVVIGAFVANRTLSDVGPTVGRAIWRGTIALAAALGGLGVALLAGAPARAAQRADTFAPHVIVASYAVAGVLVGLVLALVAVNSAAVGANVAITTGWLWLLAAVAAVDAYAGGRRADVVQLGVWQISSDGPWFHGVYLPGAVLATISAFVIGVAAAWPAARRGTNRLWAMLSGAAGPLIAVAGYAFAAPTLTGVNHESLPAHRVVPVAVAAGLLGSLPVGLLATARRRPRMTAARIAAAPITGPITGPSTGPAAAPVSPAAPTSATKTEAAPAKSTDATATEEAKASSDAS